MEIKEDHVMEWANKLADETDKGICSIVDTFVKSTHVTENIKDAKTYTEKKYKGKYDPNKLDERIRENEAKLNGCIQHEFEKEHVKQIATSWYCICKNCKGRVHEYFVKGYIEGLKHGRENK